MSNLLPNIFSYLKDYHRIVSADSSKELVYRVSAQTNNEYEVSKEILEMTFEEFINTMSGDKELLFSFGNIGIDKFSLTFYCRTHAKFRKFYERRTRSKNRF
jgi:hypothetical protein